MTRCLLTVFSLAAATRIVHLWFVQESLYADVLFGDARGYWDWAGRIAAGEWLGNEVFYQAPLYPYLLAVLRFLGGEPLAVRLLQGLLGSLACVLIAWAAACLFDRGAGWYAGIGAAIYPPAIFFDGLVQKTSLAFFLTAALVACLVGITRRSGDAGASSLHPFCAGLALGGLALTREPTQLWIPVVLAAIAWPALRIASAQTVSSRTASSRPRRRTSGIPILACVAGVALVLVPVGARNAYVGGEIHVSTVQAGPNFYIGNRLGASGLYQPLRAGRGSPGFERRDAVEMAERSIGHGLSPGEVSGFWIDRTVRENRGNLAGWGGLLMKKGWMTLHGFEIPDTESLEAYADVSPILRHHRMVGFNGLLALAAAGAWFRRRQWQDWWWIAALAGLTLVGVALFFVAARYRMPAVALLLPLAAVGAGGCIDRIRLRRKFLPGLAVAVAATLLGTAFPVEIDPVQSTRENLGGALTEAGKLEQAESVLRQAVKNRPESYLAHYNLGVVLERHGASGEAERHFATASRLRPDFVEAAYNLGQMLLRRDETEGALTAFRRALVQQPDHGPSLAGTGQALLRVGRHREAVDLLLRAVNRLPDDPQPRVDLGQALAAIGQHERSIDVLRQAARLEPRRAGVSMNLGLALATTQRLGEAADAFRQALDLQPDFPEAHNNLGTVLARLGETDLARMHFMRALEIRPDYREAEQNLARTQERR